MKPRVIKAWAIEAKRSPDEPSAFLGVGYWRWPDATDAHLRGCTTALFPTRKAARIAKLNRPYMGRVVRVTVTIKAAK